MQQSETNMEENIIPLILEVASQFQRSGPDVQNIQKAIQDIRETETVRRENINDSRSLLQKMSRDLQLSRSKGSRKHIDPESLKHDTQMYEMDKKKFSIAKSIQNLDQDIASLEAEVQQLRYQSLELDSTYKSNGTTNGMNNDEYGMLRDDEPVPDDTMEILDDTAHATAVLRLQLYRGLGIEMLENDLGAYTKARIRSNARNDVRLVKFDDKLSPYFQTNLIWDFAS
ncbi:hypothetical protein BGZ76_011674 [Entomortierella beljakovae]|nr:hypothetical protein BGZ76_011674 [Entomortierella beljakovae]